MSVSRSRAGLPSFSKSNESSRSRQGPIFGCGWTSRIRPAATALL
jgi:hypothetical protein